ncbi:MAG: GIY-YIG nuclease family protein [Pseudomonadota bacterium]|nr:GIY-YIG nuclease family protein [Pseudomonadota bacterium]
MSDIESVLTPLTPLTEKKLEEFKLARNHGVYLLYDGNEKVIYVGSSKEGNKYSTVKKRLSSYFSSDSHNPELRDRVRQGGINFRVYYSEHPRSTEGLFILKFDTVRKGYNTQGTKTYNKRNEFSNIAREMDWERKNMSSGYKYFIGFMLSQLGQDRLTLLEKRGYQDLVAKVRQHYWIDIPKIQKAK